VQAALLAIMVLAAMALFLPRMFTPARSAVFTRLEPGDRTRVVVIMPTALTPEFRDLARAAIDSVRRQVELAGNLFETVGVSDQWDVRHGIEELQEIGPFDEVIVGRNWLNHGVELYISSVGARPVVPQIVVVNQSIHMDSLPYDYGPLRFVKRVAGTSELLQWSRDGFRLNSSGAHE
jgi:hypothetical protein